MRRPPSATRLETPEQEVKRQLWFLRRLIAMKGLTLVKAAERIGWKGNRLNLILSGKAYLRYADLLRILAGLDIVPGDFFKVFYSEDEPAACRLFAEPLASDLRGAHRWLAGSWPLCVKTADFAQLYVRRGWSPEPLITSLTQNRRRHRPSRWFVAGQGGVGTTTEVSVLGHTLAREGFLPWRVDVRGMRPPPDAKTVLAVALRALAPLVERLEIEPSDRRQLAAVPGKPVSVHRLARLLEVIADASRRQLGRDLLLVVEGLEHLAPLRGFRFFRRQLETLLRPAVSQIVVLPFYLLTTPLEDRFEARTCLLPPVPIVDELGIEEIDPDGRAFFDELLGRYLPLKLISKKARRNLIRLSGGVPGDLVALTGQACEIAEERVVVKHVDAVAEKRRKRWPRFASGDLVTLREVVDDPFRLKTLSLSLTRLVATKAVLAQPRKQGLAFEVHPILRPLLR